MWEGRGGTWCRDRPPSFSRHQHHFSTHRVRVGAALAATPRASPSTCVVPSVRSPMRFPAARAAGAQGGGEDVARTFERRILSLFSRRRLFSARILCVARGAVSPPRPHFTMLKICAYAPRVTILHRGPGATALHTLSFPSPSFASVSVLRLPPPRPPRDLSLVAVLPHLPPACCSVLAPARAGRACPLGLPGSRGVALRLPPRLRRARTRSISLFSARSFCALLPPRRALHRGVAVRMV
jgi:hypothetical protein